MTKCEDPVRWWQATVSLAVLMIGVLTFLAIGAVFGLLITNHDAPEGMIAIAGSGIGALATLLVNGREDG